MLYKSANNLIHFFYARDFIVSLFAGLLSGLFIFIVALYWDIIRSYILRNRAYCRKLFGKKSLLEKNIFITLDTYYFRRDLWNNAFKGTSEEKFPFYKGHPTHAVTFPGAFGEMLGYCSARGSTYLVENIRNIRGINIRVVSDSNVATKWNGTYINLGSSASNQKTDHIKHLPQNIWLKEDINGPLKFVDGKEYYFEDRLDKAYLMKIDNPYSPGHTLFVCAGLGEWGTSGAAYFLSTNWIDLCKRFGKNPFLIVIAVNIGSDESAHEINAYGDETKLWKFKKRIRNYWRKFPFQ